MKIIYPVTIALLFQFFFSCDQALNLPQPSQSSHRTDSQRTQKRDTSAANIVYKSTDGGHTWHNISKGLPKPVKEDYSIGRHIFSDDNGLWLTADNGIYHSNSNATTPVWKKEIFSGEYSSFSSGNSRIFAYNSRGGILQKANETGKWSPVFTNFKEKQIHSVFETAGGTIFIDTDRGLFKSTDSGIKWKALPTGGLGKMVESNGVLIASSSEGILRSTDDGENWKWVIKEGGVGIDVECIEGGFAAITYSSASKTRRVRTSYDGGNTWQPIDAGLPGSLSISSIIQAGSLSISSIIQVGENLFCGHPDGIYQSSNKGKTWKRILCPMDGKVFNLSVTGNVIYAILRDGGC